MYNKVDTNMNFVDREKEVEKFWRENDIFKKSMENRKEGETYTFYDGPPTANGKPHIGHVETRTIKDMLLLPEGFYLLFLLHKVHIGRNTLVHFVRLLSFCLFVPIGFQFAAEWFSANKKASDPITGRSAMHFAYQPPITPHRVCGDPLTGDRRKTLLTAWRSGLSSGVIFPHRTSAPRFHHPRLAMAFVIGGTVSVTAFYYYY